MFLGFASVSRCARLVFGLLCVMVVTTSARAGFDTFSVGGDNTPASIQASVDAFRAALGDPNNANNPGPLASGRREINWDGGGSMVASPVGTPFTGFENSRGGTFTTPGTGFLQTPLDAAELTSINATYQTAFGAFSPVRIFTPLGSNITDATFSLPGSNGLIPATVTAFGAVFTDVDLPNITEMEFFDPGGNSILTLNAAPGTVGSASLSFLGAVANAGERIARVRITTGNSALGPNDLPADFLDVVAMDDFLYSEPVVIPEPMSMALMIVGMAVGAITLRSRRRRGCLRR